MTRTIVKTATAALAVLSVGLFAVQAGASPNAVDQYTEQVPTPVGERPPDESAPAPGVISPTGGDQESGVYFGLPGGGDSGDGARGGSDPTSGPGGGAGNTPVESSDSGLTGSFISGMTGGTSDGGMGALFPVALIGSLLLVVGVMTLRARRGDNNPVPR